MYKTIRCAASVPAKLDTRVVGLHEDCALPKSVKSKQIAEAAQRAECTGKAGTATTTYLKDGTRLILVGLGKADGETGAAARQAGSAFLKIADTCEASAAEVIMPDAALYGPFAEGVGLAAFTFDRFKDEKRAGVLTITTHGTADRRAMKRGAALAESANLSRLYSCTPPNIATPAWMATQARALARKTGLTCQVIKGKALADRKLIGLQTVGQASANPPCLIRLVYEPSGRKKNKAAVVLGKTITYDSGGLSLKINNGMRGMKYDKNGGCAVLGVMHAVATVIKPRRKVVGLLVCAENSVSDNAYRPDDIIRYMNGVSVEVTNTDAEGRLVLADGLCWACKYEKPELIIDMATLTGGVVVALGDACAGLWCDDDTLRAKIEDAADATGEKVWRLPLWPEYKKMMKSDCAELINSNPNRKAHPIQGAAFLAYFVDEKIPWAHIDIAGVSVVDASKLPFEKGPTGFGVRLVAEALGA
ncbi:MAG: leucyl aminopeptidase family protein [Phycisphaerales bacterium]|nr:leucyl aminopeptidase family protein [Phycisphaerales bacterium]